MNPLRKLAVFFATVMRTFDRAPRVGWKNFPRETRRSIFGIHAPITLPSRFFLPDGRLRALAGAAGTVATVRRAGIPSGSPSEIDANVKIRWVDDMLMQMADKEADLLKYLGGFSNFTFNNTKIEWVEDDMWNRRPKLGSGTIMSGSSGTGTIVLAAGTNHRYPIGTILFNVTNGEYVRIEAHDSGGANITVRRDLTSAVTEASLDWLSTDEVIVGGFSMHENDAWVARPTAIFNLPFNLAQIAHVAADVTYRRQETALYGLRGTDLDKVAADTVAEQMVYIEEEAAFGSRNVGASNIPATFGGLRFYITSANGAQESDLNGAALTRKDIDDLLQDLYFEVGGSKMAKTILTSPWGHRKISSFFSGAERLGPMASEGGVVIDRFNTSFGAIEVLMHTAIAQNEMYFIRPETNKIGHHGERGRPHLEEAVSTNSSGQTGPFLRRVFYADLSMMCKGVQGEGRLFEFSTSS